MAKLAAGQVEVSVTRKEFLTPHFIRVYLTGEVEQFKHTTIGDNNKILIPPDGLNEIHFPEFDEAEQKWIQPPKEVAPSVRTYTHRGIDLERKELIIDFVNHGDTGPASEWALQAKPGDKLGVMMRTEPKELYPEADWYLLVGDATAIPVISAILESLPSTAKGVCMIEVPEKADEQVLQTKAAVEFIWLHNPTPDKGSVLAELVRGVVLEEKSRFAYVAAEFATVKAIRTYLRKEMDWQQNELYAYSYWKAGVSEDKSQPDRQKEKNSVA